MTTRSVVVTGGAGTSGQLIARELVSKGFDVHAVDRREGRNLPEGVTFHRGDVRKRSLDDVLRRIKPWAVVHLARVHRLEADAAERHRINFEGTTHVFATSFEAGVQKIVFPSRHTVYGALPDQPQFLTEEHPPSAGRTYPEIQDMVAADLYACGMLWRYPEREVVVLRPVNIIGPVVENLFCHYLSQPRVFTVAGFDPPYQVLHEQDFARAVQLALEPGLKGVFNVAGPDPVPLHLIVEESGARRVPLPEPLVRVAGGRMGFASIPRGAVDYLKYPCTVDGTRFTQATRFAPEHGLRQTLRSMARRRASV